MKTQAITYRSDALSGLFKATLSVSFLPVLLLLLSIQSSRAGSATWNLNPTSGDWNTAANWTPETVPDSSNDTATFGVSNTTAISCTVDVYHVNGIVFNPGASAFTITYAPFPSVSEFFFDGVGIINNSELHRIL